MGSAMGFGWNNLDFSPWFCFVVLKGFLLEQALLFLAIHRQPIVTNVVMGLSVVCVRDQGAGKERRSKMTKPSIILCFCYTGQDF